MRIYFRTLTLPKKAAKRVKDHFTIDILPDQSMKLAKAQNLTARMLGYDNWHELVRVTKSASKTPSLLDEDAEPQEQRSRIDYQTEILGTVSPLHYPALRQLSLKLRVSAGLFSSENLVENAFHTNTIRSWFDPNIEEYEWHFCPSLRSNKVYEELSELRDSWESGELKYGEYKDFLDGILTQQPENVTAITNLLTASIDADCLEYIRRDLFEFEKSIDLSIPIEFPRRKKTVLNWSIIDNRDFHRAVALLAESFYQTGQFKKARLWFDFSDKTCDQFREYNAPFLKDLRLKIPTGSVHRLD